MHACTKPTYVPPATHVCKCPCRHADCVEYLATNGADPLVADERRGNTCLHFAVLYGHSDCVDKLLGSRVLAVAEQVRGGQQFARATGEGGHGWLGSGK